MSCGVPPTGSAPSLIMPASTAGWAMISLTCRFSVAITSGGVPLGAKKPNHEPASKPGKPLSATVGTSGSERERFALLTAIGPTELTISV